MSVELADSLETDESTAANRTSVNPLDWFHSGHYHRHNQRRQEHLASLGLDLEGRSVLEVGAGVGDHTSFFIDRGCVVTSTEGREENLQLLRQRYPEINVRHLDLDRPDESFRDEFDVVYCYGLLYHLQHPLEAIAYMSSRCRETLLLETCVAYGDDLVFNPTPENIEDPTQSTYGMGCRPTRRWVHDQLQQRFAHVYMPLTQPWHPEFPLDWSVPPTPDALRPAGTGPFFRSVFIASRTPIERSGLTEVIPERQTRH